ncbi:MAG: hypothetical protein C0433_05735, partial [Cyclobacterium sp.]|nr:hypothetical protein [Cyclobacterium sp.]
KRNLSLNFPWPQPIENKKLTELNTFDLLLATATIPTRPRLSINDISNKIKNDTQRRYFYNNIENGIITAEDFKLLKLISCLPEKPKQHEL